MTPIVVSPQPATPRRQLQWDTSPAGSPSPSQNATFALDKNEIAVLLNDIALMLNSVAQLIATSQLN